MNPEYLALAAKRATFDCRPHAQVEKFGYDFRDWVSPFTKGANHMGGVALVLQDWASDVLLLKGVNPEIQEHGRLQTLHTNRRLETLLRNVLGLELSEVYVTNAFPFIKSGAMDARLRQSDVERSVEDFALKELDLVRPVAVLALGAVPFTALTRAGRSCIRLPHPAARVGSLRKHEEIWREQLACTRLVIPDWKLELRAKE